MADHPPGRAPIARAGAVRAETPRLRWRRIGTRAADAICFVPPRRCATHGQTPWRSGRKNRWDARWSEWHSLQFLILGRGITNQWEERACKDPLVPAKAGPSRPCIPAFAEMNGAQSLLPQGSKTCIRAPETSLLRHLASA